MLERGFGTGLLPTVGLRDLLWQLEPFARKFRIEAEAFSRLKREIRSFSCERTALASRASDERLYLLRDESALKQHNEVRLFEVGVDGTGLLGI